MKDSWHRWDRRLGTPFVASCSVSSKARSPDRSVLGTDGIEEAKQVRNTRWHDQAVGDTDGAMIGARLPVTATSNLAM